MTQSLWQARHLTVVWRLVLWAVVGLPSFAWAQTGTIAGSVKDVSGAVIPGVTVEAASPALIEKIRTVVTDSQGEYKIVNLAPGAYTVTFALAGFAGIKHDGIDLVSDVTATVNAELRVGAVEETITVSGQSPLVDVQNTTQHRTVTREIMDAVPTGRTWADYAVLLPGVTAMAVIGGPTTVAQDVGGTAGDANPGLAVHGSSINDMKYIVDGMISGNVSGTGGYSAGTVSLNNAMIQEIAVDTAGATASVETSGVRANIIPKQGGNRFSGFFYGNYTNDRLEADNLDAALKANGATQYIFNSLYDFNPAVGGPIQQDRMWFYSSFRYFGNSVSPPGAHYALNPSSFQYAPDLTRTPANKAWTANEEFRVTWQTSERTKLNVYAHHDERQGASASSLSSTQSFEATMPHPINNTLLQGAWNWTVSNRLLFQLAETYLYYRTSYQPQAGYDGAIPVIDSGLGLTYHGMPTGFLQHSHTQNGIAAISYVTGSHNFKVGASWLSGTLDRLRIDPAVQYRFVNGVPTSLTLNTTPYDTVNNVKLNFGAYAQDQWTRNRLTLNMGVRFDYLNGYFPAQCTTGTQFVPAGNCVPAGPNLPDWKDIDPRVGASFDLFGNGNTALKWFLGRFPEAQANGLATAVNPLQGPNATTTRSWSDLDKNFIPDCNLANPAINGECGRDNNVSFGSPTLNLAYDPATITGWGKRGYNWELMAGVQRQVHPGLSVDASYNRRWYGNLRATVNQATTPREFSPYCVTTPVNPQLPGGGGQHLCGLYDVVPSLFGVNNSVITLASNYGKASQVYDGVDLAVTMRLPRGILLQGSTSTGRTNVNNCDVVLGHPEITSVGSLITASQATLPAIPAFCNIAPPFQTQVKLLGSYPLPWWSLKTAVTLQSVQQPVAGQGGLEGITAQWTVSNALIAPSLGRNLASGPAGTAQVNIVPAGTLYGDRLNQLDFRLSKSFNMGRTLVQPQFELFNLLNGNTITAVNTAYGARWQYPTAILPPRFVKLSVQITF